MIALGSETSSKIMKQLPESIIQQVSYEIANTDYVSPEERDEVMNEFVNTAQARQYVLDGGIEYARNLLNQALGPQKAKEVIEHDNVVDQLFDEVKKDIINLIQKGSGDAEDALDLLMVAKYFERIGDHATNIAEWVIYSLKKTEDE